MALNEGYLKCLRSLQKNQWIHSYLKNFSQVCNEHDVLEQIFPDVKGSPQSIPTNYFKSEKYKKIKRKNKTIDIPIDENKHVVINCKNKALNHYINQHYDKFDEIPLASKGWNHRGSKGDFIKINICEDNEKKENIFWPSDDHFYESLGLDSSIIETVKKLGFIKPTHIQLQGIPAVLKNQNTLLAGETGSGKTLAFLLPLIQHILEWRSLTPERKLNTPLGLILTPGRELSYQIGDVADKFAQELLFNVQVVTGGHTKRLMTHPDFRPIDLLVSSIGAVRKLTTTGIFNMSYVRHIVLDEADTLLDDSFNDLTVKYLKHFPVGFEIESASKLVLPSYCRMTMASATLPTSITSIMGEIIMPESLVRIESPRLHQVLVHVPQHFIRTNQSQKPSLLLELAKKNASKDIPTIIFSNRSKVCDWVSMFLNENGISCVNLNGDMPTDVRKGRFDQFQRGFVDFLSCSDMVSRGLDTVRAKHVINYDFPIYMSDYIHRCGRVGRIGHKNDCLITNFVSGVKEVELVQKIETAVRTVSDLPNVNANITRIIHSKMMKNM